MDTAVDVALIIFTIIVLAVLLRSIRKTERDKQEQNSWRYTHSLTVIAQLTRIADALDERR